MSQHNSPQDDAFRPPSLEELGALLPQFEMKDFLAQGGMGAVYLARQVSLDRLVAIKVLPPAWGADAGYAQLFQTEARAMAKMHHNHIVGVFDFGITSGGHFYLVMEYVPGRTLHEMIRLKKLPVMQVQGLALQLCEAVAYAHEHGVLHRDIKPGNVLVSNSGEVKIADFGLARHTGAAVEETSLGTPDYAAPELFATGAMVDHRADIYALGIVFQEMLTGKVPRRPREPLSEYGVFDPGWEPLIAKAAHDDPARRYRTVRELREAVTNVNKRVARAATPPAVARSRPYVPPPAAESPAFPWMSVLAVLVIAGVAGAWWWRNRDDLPASTTGTASTTSANVSPETGGAGVATASSTPENQATETSAPEATMASASDSVSHKPFTPGPAFALDAMPPGHLFKLPEGHKDIIYCVEVFPDQRHVATGSADGIVAVWDLQTGERLRSFGPVTGSVLRVAISPDGRSIAASGGDYKVWVWSMDAAPGAPPREMATSARSVPYMLFSEDGGSLVMGTTDATQNLLVWDWKKDVPPDVVPGFRSTVNGLDHASGISSGAVLVSGQRFDNGRMVTELWLIDPARRSLVRKLADPPPYIFRTKIAPDGRTAVAMLQGKLVSWDIETGAILANSQIIVSTSGEPHLLDGGRLVLHGTLDRTIHVMETLTGKDLWGSGPVDTMCTLLTAPLSGGRYVVSGAGWRPGNPVQKDGDYALHVWALPDLATLKSEEASKAAAGRQMLTLENDDPELWALLTRLATEWNEKTTVDANAGKKELDEKYLSAIRRDMNSASPRDREAFLSEISRIANGAAGTLAAGAPPALARWYDIYQQQVALIPQKAQAVRTELSASHQIELSALGKKRTDAADAAGAARVELVMQALTELNGEMVLARLQEHFLPKKPQPQVPSYVTTAPGVMVTSTSVAPGAPLPRATGEIPPYTRPLRGLTRPVSLHRVDVWPRNRNIITSQSAISRIPADLGPVVALAVGGRHALALKPDGTVVQWGNEDSRVLGVPEGVDRIVAIDAGSSVSVCLRDDGTVIAWNTRQMLPQRSDQRPVVVATATYSYVLALHEDGSGTYMSSSPTSTGSNYAPASGLTGFTQACTANNCGFGLKRDGTVVGWGRPPPNSTYSMTDSMPQAELVDGISIASLTDLGFLLKRDGTLVAWGQSVPAELLQRPRFPGATRIIGARPYTGLVIGFQPGIWKFLSFSDNRYPIDTDTADRMARGCTEIGIGQYFILGLRPL